MNASASSSLRVPTVLRRARPAAPKAEEQRSSLPVIAALSLAVFVTSCGKKEEAAPAVTSAAPVAAAPAPAINVESEIANALSGKAPAPASTPQLQQEAEAILDKYPTYNAADLLNVPEVSPRLRNLLAKLAQDKALQARINSSVDLAAQIKGLEGAARLDLDMKGYSRARSSRMLQAALSEDPQQLVSFLVGEIGEATPDLSYGGLERAPNGVSIVPNPAATPASASSPPAEQD